MPGDNLFLVDNISSDNTVSKYLRQWCGVSKQFDIATGYFEIGGLLELDGEWQKMDKIRIILGSEVTKRTGSLLSEAVNFLLDHFKSSIDLEKEKDEFLFGVPAILSALKSGKIVCKVFDKEKFHAKAYITYFREEYHQQFIEAMNVPNGYGLVGSSNFTRAGLTRNFELNVQFASNVDQLQRWYEDRWNEATDISEAILSSVELHCRNYSPFDVYIKSMYELFMTNEETISEWEERDSKIFPLLSKYQIDGYNSLVKIAAKYRGALLCDGVGLGKTFQGLMLIERIVKKERKNVVLIVPAGTRLPVWEANIKKYMPEILEGFYTFKIINHTDLLLEKNSNLMEKISEQAEYVIIDEAHHFRNRGSGRYRKLFDMMERGPEKRMFLLTATPINNSFLDLQHLIELFTHRQDNYFSGPPLGIHSVSGHFKKMESKLNLVVDNDYANTSENLTESEVIFRNDALVDALVVQRSRAYVRKSLLTSDTEKVLFSVRKPPIVAEYSLKRSYGKLINDFIDSFYRVDNLTGRTTPLLALAVYSPYADIYFIGDKSKIDKMKQGRQNQIVNLIRQLLLKRFESSAAAFEETSIRIFVRLRKFLEDYKSYGSEREINRFFERHQRVTNYISQYINSYTAHSLEELEDDLPEYLWEIEENLNIEDFDIQIMLEDTLGDLEVLGGFVKELMEKDESSDDKINTLIRLLRENGLLQGKKVIIFSEFRTTAQYIHRKLLRAGFDNVFELDGQSKFNRKEIIERFSPYYNDKRSSEIENEIQILIATDVLAEGINLQDATCLVNYELHWNPVRLMQRIGRIDRRRSKETEELLLLDHPNLTSGREFAYYWNFLPPEELERLLSLYQKVSKKTLRISRVFGIEGRKLLTPDDDYEALKDFNSAYEGEESKDETLALEYQSLMQEYPDYASRYVQLPKKIFSGKISSERKGIFFCYELPNKKVDGSWTSGDGFYKWFIFDTQSNEVNEHVFEVWKTIQSQLKDNRILTVTNGEFTSIRKKIEIYINKSYMRNIQAPIGIKPRLAGWMELG
ncbi:helicase-related protein [Paenibacillus wynnii]|uniref:helicase-related protein n=1 Tax=Paenibacillus wynnii TaxID=268407 RepID=UPI00279353A7|nr:helicase-related protein [Paenibacillus wynnii]MDQ0195735.1 ERCC4-related helicase [Paenibacillus wynnii]